MARSYHYVLWRRQRQRQGTVSFMNHSLAIYLSVYLFVHLPTCSHNDSGTMTTTTAIDAMSLCKWNMWHDKCLNCILKVRAQQQPVIILKADRLKQKQNTSVTRGNKNKLVEINVCFFFVAIIIIKSICMYLYVCQHIELVTATD